MNTTIANSTFAPSTVTTPAASDAGNQFTLANVIGMMLTLQLCQLTQPYGSLLFRGISGFYWRCNPISSFVEACIIYWHLGAEVLRSWKEGPSATFKRLQAVSSGLLLLRGATGEYAELMGKLKTGDSLEAFGSNALAHKQLRIDLFTAFTELTIFIKLIAVRGDGWFTAAGFFLVCGWAAVQTLLLLFDFREMSEMEMTAAVDITGTVNAELEERADGWKALFIVLHLPFFGYVAYLASFLPWQHSGFVGFLRGFYRFLGVVISALVSVVAYWGGIVGTLKGLGEMSCPGNLLFLLTFPVSCVWLLYSSLSYMQQNCGGKSLYCAGNFTSFFQPQSPMYYIVDESFDVIYKGLLLLLFLALISIVFIIVVMPDEDSETCASSCWASIERMGSSLGNVLFLLVVFVVYLIRYDPSKTSKPTWTDFLG